MADTTDQLKLMIEMINTVVNPVNQSLAKHSEAVQLAVTLINRLVELYSQEPTRNTIIKEMREELRKVHEAHRHNLDEHDDCCKERNTALNQEASRRVEEIIRKASEFMDKMIEEHEAKMKTSLEEHKKIMESTMAPVGPLKDKFVWLLTALGLGYAITLGVFFYVHSAVAKIEDISKVVDKLVK